VIFQCEPSAYADAMLKADDRAKSRLDRLAQAVSALAASKAKVYLEAIQANKDNIWARPAPSSSKAGATRDLPKQKRLSKSINDPPKG
jgi:hypothetical protein